MHADSEFLKLVRELLQAIREDIVQRVQRGDRPTPVFGELDKRRTAAQDAVRKLQNSRQQASLFREEAERD